jgi:hypothetical protein
LADRRDGSDRHLPVMDGRFGSARWRDCGH